jgi:hypothetical protein
MNINTAFLGDFFVTNNNIKNPFENDGGKYSLKKEILKSVKLIIEKDKKESNAYDDKEKK